MRQDRFAGCVRATLAGLALIGVLLGAAPSRAQAVAQPDNDPISRALAQDDFATALKLAQPLADKGDAEGENVVGLLYLNGWGVRQDFAKSAYWYGKAAAQGVVAAQNNLGTLYRRGEGVPQDFRKAAYWFQKAADKGAIQAYVNLGELYEAGEGVPQDYKIAASWYHKAAIEQLEQWNTTTPPTPQ